MATKAADREIVISRLIDAPRELVFAAFTGQDHVSHWWGPNGFTTTTEVMDVRKGGQWVFTMHGPDGKSYPNRIRYTAVDPPERIAYDQDCGEGMPLLFNAEATFEAKGRKTLVTLRMVAKSAEQRNALVKFGAIEGGEQTLARLDSHLASQVRPPRPVFEITRMLDAPHDLVWRCHSEAEHLQSWWGPKGCKLGVEALEFRPGGMFHYVMRYSTGSEMWGRFIYREIRAPRRLVYLSSFANAGGGIARAPFSSDCPMEFLNEMTLDEVSGKTRLHLRSAPFGSDAKETNYFAELMPSMEKGFGGTYDQLRDYIATLGA